MTFWQQYKEYLVNNAKFLCVQAHVYLITTAIVGRIVNGKFPLPVASQLIAGLIGAVTVMSIIGAIQVYIDRRSHD